MEFKKNCCTNWLFKWQVKHVVTDKTDFGGKTNGQTDICIVIISSITNAIFSK